MAPRHHCRRSDCLRSISRGTAPRQLGVTWVFTPPCQLGAKASNPQTFQGAATPFDHLVQPAQRRVGRCSPFCGCSAPSPNGGLRPASLVKRWKKPDVQTPDHPPQLLPGMRLKLGYCSGSQYLPSETGPGQVRSRLAWVRNGYGGFPPRPLPAGANRYFSPLRAHQCFLLNGTARKQNAMVRNRTPGSTMDWVPADRRGMAEGPMQRPVPV